MKKINPSFKFIGLLLLTLELAFYHNAYLNLAVFIVSVIAVLASGVQFKKYFLLFLPVILTAVGMFVTGYRFSSGEGMPVNESSVLFSDSKLINGMIFASRVLAYAGVGYAFALTTDRVSLIRSFQQQLFLPQVFAYGLLAAWGIFPYMLEEYKRTRTAFRHRGIKVFPVSPRLLKPLLIKSVRWSESLAAAMESKGFDSNEKRSCIDKTTVCKTDFLFIFFCIIPVFLYPVIK